MSRSDLERLSREELIELVLRLQRPDKTSRTSSKPPATDRKERREPAKPGGAKPGHEGHSRAISDDPDVVVEHRSGRHRVGGADARLSEGVRRSTDRYGATSVRRSWENQAQGKRFERAVVMWSRLSHSHTAGSNT